MQIKKFFGCDGYCFNCKYDDCFAPYDTIMRFTKEREGGKNESENTRKNNIDSANEKSSC